MNKIFIWVPIIFWGKWLHIQFGVGNHLAQIVSFISYEKCPFKTCLLSVTLKKVWILLDSKKHMDKGIINFQQCVCQQQWTRQSCDNFFHDSRPQSVVIETVRVSNSMVTISSSLHRDENKTLDSTQSNQNFVGYFPVHIILLHLSSIFTWLQCYVFMCVFKMLNQQSSIRLSQHPSIEIVAKFKCNSITL